MSNKLSEKVKKTMTSRIITGIILAIIAVPTFFIGGWWYVAFIAIALVFATTEFLSAAKVSKVYWLIYFFTYIAVFSLTFWIFIKNNMIANVNAGYDIFNVAHWQLERGFTELDISTLGIVVILLSIFVVLILDRNFQFEIATYMFMMIVFVGIGFQSFLFLRFYPMQQGSTNLITSSFLLLYIVIGTIGNDMGAYFIGVLFGKNKMIPRVSPNKTWEGFIGGYVISAVASFLFALICSLTGHPLIPRLDIHGNSWYLMIIFSLLMPLLANVGDLFFSVLKRNFAIKDYGKMLRGHGGVLDRIDSLIVVGLAISTIITLIENGFGIY